MSLCKFEALSTRLDICMYIRTYVCTYQYVCMYIMYQYVCMYVSYLHACIHTDSYIIYTCLHTDMYETGHLGEDRFQYSNRLNMTNQDRQILSLRCSRKSGIQLYSFVLLPLPHHVSGRPSATQLQLKKNNKKTILLLYCSVFGCSS